MLYQRHNLTRVQWNQRIGVCSDWNALQGSGLCLFRGTFWYSSWSKITKVDFLRFCRRIPGRYFQIDFLANIYILSFSHFIRLL